MKTLPNEHLRAGKSKRKHKKPCIFLDRDGVINTGGLINTPDQFVLIEGVAEAIIVLKAAGYLVGVVTNQSGLSEDYEGNVRWNQAPMNRAQLGVIHDHMLELLGDKARPNFLKFCPHAKSLKCACRKPKPGMLAEAAEHFQIDMSRSYMVGDMETDIQVGLNAGVTAVLVLTGFDPDQKDKCPEGTPVFASLPEFAKWLVAQPKKRDTKKRSSTKR